MKLRFSPTSPFVRKVLVFAHETGLADRIELLDNDIWNADSGLVAANPLDKLPTLVIDGGEALYDSRVICEYLDDLHDGRKLFPASGGERLQALRRQALADGIMDAAVLRIYEGNRPENERSPDWDAKQAAKVEAGLDTLEEEVESFGEQLNIGLVAIASILGYLEFRFPDDNWRRNRPALADWFEGIGDRPSMAATMPRVA